MDLETGIPSQDSGPAHRSADAAVEEQAVDNDTPYLNNLARTSQTAPLVARVLAQSAGITVYQEPPAPSCKQDDLVDVYIVDIAFGKESYSEHFSTKVGFRKALEKPLPQVGSEAGGSRESVQAGTPLRVLLVEDLSLATIEIIGSRYNVPPGVFLHHINGGEFVRHDDTPSGGSFATAVLGNLGRSKKSLPVAFENVETYLNDLPEDESLSTFTWRGLSFHTRKGYLAERAALQRSGYGCAALKRIVAPVLPIDITHSEASRVLNAAPQIPQSRIYRPHHAVTGIEDDTWGCSAEERVTIYECEDRTTFLVLFDKPRSLSELEYKAVLQERQEKQVSNRSLELPSHTTGRQRQQSFKKSTQLELPGKPRPTFFHRASNVINWSKGLAKTAHGMESDARTLGSEDHTTREVFLGLLRGAGASASALHLEEPQLRFNSARIDFLHLAMYDWKKVFSRMDSTLDDIDGAMSEDALVRDRLSAWRQLLCSWRFYLVQYRENLDTTLSKLPILDPEPPQSGEKAELASEPHDQQAGARITMEAPIVRDYKQLVERVKQLEGRVDRSFQALMSTMSILESKNAIQQAESIGKLTELAFIFIPLSFAASYFGMEIKNWDASKPRLMHFWILGIGLLFVAYMVRIGIRSHSAVGFVAKLESKARLRAGIPDGQELPVRAITAVVWNSVPKAAHHPIAAVSVNLVILAATLPWAILHCNMVTWLPTTIVLAVITPPLSFFCVRSPSRLCFLALLAVPWFFTAINTMGIVDSLALRLAEGFLMTGAFFALAAVIVDYSLDFEAKQLMATIIATPLVFLAAPISLVWAPWAHRPVAFWKSMVVTNCAFIVFSGVEYVLYWVFSPSEIHIFASLWYAPLLLVGIVGAPSTLLWHFAPPNWPLYTLITITYCFLALFSVAVILVGFVSHYERGVGRSVPLLRWKERISWLILCSALMATAPGILIWHGEINTLENWSRSVRIGATCGLTFGHFFLHYSALLVVYWIGDRYL